MSSLPNDPNPYAAPPITAEMPFDSGERSIAMTKIIKDFRSQSLALGVVWIIFGVIAVGLIALLSTTDALADREEGGPIFLAILAALGVLWFAAGIGTLMKQLWGVYIGLVMGYLSLIGNLLSFNLCALAITIFVLVQAHRVIGFARKMQAEGIPLNVPR